MRAQKAKGVYAGFENLEEVRLRRDRALALAYVRKGQRPTAIAEIMRETGVKRRTAYRAIKRELPWAIAEFEKEGGTEPETNGPNADSTALPDTQQYRRSTDKRTA